MNVQVCFCIGKTLRLVSKINKISDLRPVFCTSAPQYYIQTCTKTAKSQGKLS